MYIAGLNRAIDTGDTYFTEVGNTTASGSQSARLKMQSRMRIVITGNMVLRARAEYGRWIVDCPNCHNAEFYFEDNKFECSECKLSANVEMPKERKAIETILGKRNIVNRHWEEPEMVGNLEKENVIMGVM